MITESALSVSSLFVGVAIPALRTCFLPSIQKRGSIQGSKLVKRRAELYSSLTRMNSSTRKMQLFTGGKSSATPTSRTDADPRAELCANYTLRFMAVDRTLFTCKEFAKSN